MYLSPIETIGIILAVALGTMITRFLPFVLFPESKEPPEAINYLGKVLPAAMMGLLVVYCLKGISLTKGSRGLPEFIAITAIVIVHQWKHNVLLSIVGGSILYMILVQVVFI